MTSGEERRRRNLYTLSSFEISQRKNIAQTIFIIVNAIVLTVMILIAVLVSYLSTRYMGYIGLYIAFFGSLLDVIFGMFIAYYFGQKISKTQFITKNWKSLHI